MPSSQSPKVLIVGLGVSGKAASAYFKLKGAEVLAIDAKEPREYASVVRSVTQKLKTGEEPVDLVVLSPGVDPRQDWLEALRARGVPFTNEPTLGLERFHQAGVPILAVTGSAGKTTTATLIGEGLKALGYRAVVAGNIGRSLLEASQALDAGEKPDAVVAELSSFQLELARGFVPSVTVVTLLHSDHLDRYDSQDAYFEAKARLLRLGDARTVHVLNGDSPSLEPYAREREHAGQTVQRFGAAGKAGHIEGRAFMVEAHRFTLERSRMLGEHNARNWMAAILACAAFVKRLGKGISEADARALQGAIDAFPGIPHRIEWVARVDGVDYYNDSKSTNLAALESSLSLFPDASVHLIAGGKEKGLEFESLRPLVARKCKSVVAYGQAAGRLSRAWGGAVAPLETAETLIDAVEGVHARASAGEVALLSPACSSLDQYRNFEERGDHFKEIVRALGEDSR